MKSLPLIHFVTIVLLGVVFFSCKKEKPVLNENEGQNFELTIEKIGYDFSFNWTPTNISDFERYVILGSRDSIPNSFNLALASNSFEASFESQAINSFDSLIVPFSSYLFFRAFVVMGNRTLASNLVRTEYESFHIVPYTPSIIFPNPDNKSIILLDFNESKLIRYHLPTKAITAEETMNELVSFGTVEKWNGYSELYLTGEDRNIKIFDALTLEYKDFISTGAFEVFSMDTNDDGLVATSIKRFNIPVQFFKRDNSSFLSSTDFNSYSQPRGIAFLSKNENKGIEISSLGIGSFQLDDDGQIIDDQFLDFPLPYSNYEQLVVSPNGNYFGTSRDGLFFDKDLNLIGELDYTPATIYEDYIFSPDENFLYALSNGFSKNELIKYSIPDLEIQERLELGYEPKSVFWNEGKIFVVGMRPEETIIQGFEF